MSATRYAPHHLRTRYLRALDTVPVRVAPADPIDIDLLTVLGTATVAGRPVRFGTATSAPKLWIAFTGIEPALLGYMTGLVIGEPQLWVCTDTHWTWALEGTNTTELKQAAAQVWHDCQRTCEGQERR